MNFSTNNFKIIEIEEINVLITITMDKTIKETKPCVIIYKG